MRNKIKDKKGAVTILFCVLIGVFLAFLMIIIDMGRAFAYKEELQQIADAMSLAGVNVSSDMDKNDFAGAKYNIKINKSTATSKASEIMKSNINQQDNKEIYDISAMYNFQGQVSTNTQNLLYDNGVFNVRLTGKIKKMFFGGDINIKVTSTSRVKAVGENKDNANETKVKILNDSKGDTIQVRDRNNSIIFEKSVGY